MRAPNTLQACVFPLAVQKQESLSKPSQAPVQVFLRVSHLFHPHHHQQRQKSSDIPSQEVDNLIFLQMKKLRLWSLYGHQLITAHVYWRAP